MPATNAAVLLLADISGYTQFVRMHDISTAHAREITGRLLNALVQATRPPLRVAEIEGDAVFLYAVGNAATIDRISTEVKQQVPRLFRAFRNERAAIERIPICTCEACTTVGNLRLKQIVHAGEVAMQRIDRFEKPFGLNVVIAHRLLKNTVPSKEYLMLSDAAFRGFRDFFGEEGERRTERYEDVGDLETVVFYEPQLASVLGRLPADDVEPPTGVLRVIAWRLGMLRRTLAGLVRRRRPVD